MDGTLNLLKLIALGLLVVVLGGAAINTFKFGQMAKVAQQRGQQKHQEFLNNFPERARNMLERDLAEMRAERLNPGVKTACRKIRDKEPKSPHRTSPKSIKAQHARSWNRWRENVKRICYGD